jgi:hypothetical protein
MALGTGDASYALISMNREDEPDIKQAFQEVLDERTLGPASKELADRHFFGTVARPAR